MRTRLRLRRANDLLSLRGDPSRLPTVLVNALLVGFGVLAATGVVEALLVRDAGSLVQPLASAGFIAWGLWMKARGRPRPIPLLVVAMALSFGYLLAAAIEPTWGDVTDTSPVAIIVGAGVIALVAGGRSETWVGLYALMLAGAATVTVQTGLGEDPAEVVLDGATSVVVMGLAFAMVRSVRTAFEDAGVRYRGLVESSPVAVVDVDLAAWLAGDDLVHLGPMNPVAARILGFDDERTEAMLRRTDIPSVFAKLLDTAAVRPAGTHIETFPRSGRTLKIGWQVDPVSGRIVLTGTDITAQRLAEEALSGQVSARDRFIASVSHELRTPLAGALGLLELVAARDVADQERDEMIGLALFQVRDMVDIVEDLLVAARAADGQLTVRTSEMDLSLSVSRVLAVVDEPFEVEIHPGLRVIGDPVRVRQIVKNLMTNAVRYGGPDRRVIVRTNGARHVVEVRDSGPPLDIDFAARMFEPYQRAGADRSHDSVGLGLTVARTLATLMGGDLAYSHDGEVVFRLTLPAAPGQAAPS